MTSKMCNEVKRHEKSRRARCVALRFLTGFCSNIGTFKHQRKLLLHAASTRNALFSGLRQSSHQVRMCAITTNALLFSFIMSSSAQARQNFISEQLETQHALSYEALGEMLRVSTMTVRRDADALAARGVLLKTVGGVQKTQVPDYLRESTLLSRLSEYSREKKAIARLALDLLENHKTVYLDGGTTCLELARQIAAREDAFKLTVVTNSALACVELGRRAGDSIIGIGGEYDAHSLSFCGSISEEFAAHFHPDIAFLSTKGFSHKEGTFESSVALLRIKQLVAKRCKRVVLLADHSKFGARALCKVLDVSQLSAVVTDEGAPRKALAALQKAGCEVHVARLEEARWEKNRAA